MQRAAAHRWRAAGQIQRFAQRGATFAGEAAIRQQQEEVRGQPQGGLGLAALDEPGARRAKVVEVELQAILPALALAAQHAGLGLLDEIAEESGMAGLDRVELVAASEAGLPVLAHDLLQSIADAAVARGLDVDERSVDESTEQRDGGRARSRWCPSRLPRRPQR